MHSPGSVEDAFILRDSMVTQLNDDEFYDFCRTNPDLRLERTPNHEIILTPPAGFESSASSNEVQFQLTLWNKQKRLGRVGESSAAFILADGATLSPDASWLSMAKWQQVPAEARNRFLPVCPEFIVEVKSPSDRLKTLQAKMEQWLRNGVLLGFLIDTETETVHVCRPGQDTQVVQGFDGEIGGEPVLPGFVLHLRELRPQS